MQNHFVLIVHFCHTGGALLVVMVCCCGGRDLAGSG